jgi:hypothetical protein
VSTLRFKMAEVRKQIEHARTSATHKKSWGQEVGAQLWLVKDDGIYLMSNGDPHPTKGEKSLSVVYAKGYDPEKDQDVWDKSREAVSGDDFVEHLSLAELEPFLKGTPKNLIVRFGKKNISITSK